ncbi:hypothetical protein [Flavobacterium denitrificans]|uniref:hypothetical protein n=1 Tax=Flavobacterium denitrificans TaxID=281361 RepID=UPI00040BC10D|nr:hypothetical protein [Flavobacterium denitrificans]
MKENWLFIKTPDHYGKPEIIEFDQNEIKHFWVEKGRDRSLVKIAEENTNEQISKVKLKRVNLNRIRFFRNGKIYKVLSDNESVIEDCVFENDYEKLNATETKLTENEIQNLKFEFNWNGEKMNIRFNEDLDSPVIQEINKRLNKEGSRILLEKLDDTLFLSFYSDIYHNKLIPIKYVDRKKMILYGFPKEPYEIVCPIIE